MNEENKIRLAIVVSEFNFDITRIMLEKAISHAKFLGAEISVIFRVPGSFDIPLAVSQIIKKDFVDAIAVLGAVIQGETRHDEVVGHQAARKIMDLSIEHEKPVALGIIGPGATRMQALERAEEYARRAVEAAIKLSKRLDALERAKYEGQILDIGEL